MLSEQGTNKCRTIKQCYNLVGGSTQGPVDMTDTSNMG